MNYTVENKSGVTILNLTGEIDITVANTLRNTLINLIENNSGPLLVNLSDVRYLDSAGLSVLIAANRKSQGLGQAFGLSNLQTPVQQVFKLTRVDKVFQIFDTLKEGISNLGNS